MRYASIEECEYINGSGIGTSLFVQGCHFHCKNCFNQDTWDFNGGKKWDYITEMNFLKLVSKPHIKRVSILGGEPLADENVKYVVHLLKTIRNLYPDKKIWLYTGYTYESIIESGSFDRLSAVMLADILVDGRFIDEEKDLTLKFRGSKNQRVINTEQSLKEKKVIKYIE